MTTKRTYMVREVVQAVFQNSTLDGQPIDLDKLTEQVEIKTQDCILCKFPSHSLGVFRPRDSIEFGGQEEKVRVVFYGTCKECFERPNAESAFEKAILANLRTDLY